MIQYYRQLLISFKKIEIQFKTKDVENDRMKYISWEESLKVLQLKKNPKNTLIEEWKLKILLFKIAILIYMKRIL